MWVYYLSVILMNYIFMFLSVKINIFQNLAKLTLYNFHHSKAITLKPKTLKTICKLSFSNNFEC